MGRLSSSLAAIACAMVVASCGGASTDEAARPADNASFQAVRGGTGADDPAMQDALRDQIMVDPALAQQANADVVRPPARPESGALPSDRIADAANAERKETLRPAPPPSPECRQCDAARRSLTLGALAESQGATAKCSSQVAYSAGWANRLPKEIPLYPDARVAEAAGADGAGCALRVVSFSSAASMQRLLDWYYTRAVDAGYRAEHQADGKEHILAGTKKGAAFFLILRASPDGGTTADLMADASGA